MKLWRRKLKSQGANLVFALMLGMQLFSGEAGDPLLAHLPKPAEPYAADWDRAEVEPAVEPVDLNRNSSPAPTGGMEMRATGTLGLTGTVIMPGDPYVQIHRQV
ncbi:hypothetical protein [Dactylosporangium sp. CA-139066]|uniref:hypothetical protein n=1 Tax=Dactylosporangium sp. CA-139066 TaxID=3239930 RepID=UPI003D923D68